MKILVVDDHALVREGLSQVLKALDESVEVLQAGTCAQAFELADADYDIELVLLDYQLPDMNGLQALAVLAQKHPELPVLLLSGVSSVQVMREAIAGGAAGFVSKASVSEELLLAVRSVLAGDIYHPPELRSGYQHTGIPSDKLPLTPRQELVLQALLQGDSNREISEALHVTDETIKSHVAAILRYFEVQNRTQAVVAATRAGYLPLERRLGARRRTPMDGQ